MNGLLKKFNEYKDIPIINQFNDISNTTVSAKFLISKIKKESLLTENTIKQSLYFSDIEKRYAESFFNNKTNLYIRNQAITKVKK